MKKILTFLLISILTIPAVFSQCTPDPNITQPGIYPDSATGLAPAIVGQPYNQVMQFKIPADTAIVYNGIPFVATILYFKLLNFTGLPAGITYSCNPASCIFPGDSNGCVLLSGTPTTPGIYPLNAEIEAAGQVTFAGQPITIRQTENIDYYYIVVGISGIAEINPAVVNLGQNYPNPVTQGLTDIDFYTPRLGEFSFKLINLLGKEVISRKVTAQKGMNTIKLNVSSIPPGVYMYSLTGKSSTLTKRMIIRKL